MESWKTIFSMQTAIYCAYDGKQIANRISIIQEKARKDQQAIGADIMTYIGGICKILDRVVCLKTHP